MIIEPRPKLPVGNMGEVGRSPNSRADNCSRTGRNDLYFPRSGQNGPIAGVRLTASNMGDLPTSPNSKTDKQDTSEPVSLIRKKTAMPMNSTRARASRNRGITAERALVRYLRDNGFAGAERAVRTGYRTPDRISADPGDITGTPGLVWSVKDCATERITTWFDELEHMRNAVTADVGLLVVKRRGHANPGEWWCWLWLGDLAALLTASDVVIPRELAWTLAPARLELADVVGLLRRGGYGDAVSLQEATG